MTPDEIAALPAGWYAARPVPERLLRDLIFCGEWFEARQVEGFTREERRALGRGYVPLSPVERAHARHLRELRRDDAAMLRQK